jgi:hypothetical protein
MKLLALALRQQEREDASPQRTVLRADVLQMIALLREAMGGGVAAELAKRLKALDDHRDQIQKGVIAWIQLIEVLVQEAERGWRKRAGQQAKGGGTQKKSQVKAALFQILNSEQARLPIVPDYLYPLVMDLAVDWTIDALVKVENDYHLWHSLPEENLWSLVDFVGWLVRSWQWAVGCLIWIYVRNKYREPLNPELRMAVKRVEDEGLLKDKRSALRSGIDFVKFVGDHGQQAIAAVKLFFDAVHQAETFLNLDGPGKKKYAHDLIVATLEDLGFPVGTGLVGIIAGAFIDTGIEAAWSIFNKRAPETFKHRSQSSGA